MKSGFIVLLLVSLSCASPRNVSHEDIRDAILSLVNMFRDNGDKLERHEYRERHLGEQLKKALVGLDKRHRQTDHNLDAISKVINRLDERLLTMEKTMAQASRIVASIPTIIEIFRFYELHCCSFLLFQRDERERIQLQKTADTLDNVQNSLQTWMTNMVELVRVSSGQNEGQDTTSGLGARIDHLANSVERLEAYVRKVSDTPTDSERETLKLASENLATTVADTERVLSHYEKKLQEVQANPGAVKVSDSQDWHSVFLTALEAHQKILQELKKLSEESRHHLHSLPSHAQITKLNNSTQELLQEIRYEMAAGTDKGIAKLDAKLSEAQATLGRGQEEILKTITDTGVIAEGVYGDITRSYEELLKEVRRSGEVESVLIQTADNVMDTKRRIEYGVHQILLEVGDLVKLHAKELNATVNRRFDNLSSTIVDNQTGALTNLTSKIETEISQVWRQIGIMYQQLTASAGALDRLQQQTETYVNGSLETMGSMGGKVGQITGLMAEMDSNLNYLLGRLSLVTQEFNSIKSDLGSALDNIRHAFISVQKKVKEFGKNGIIPIPDSQETPTSDLPDGDEGNQVSPLNVKSQ
ncbi:uncharacterized protein [Periplaneta americana]|uniref:uncharacterized protein n=1 Tax=Periplaneta americana TaxID=6978 RepID=UPI0037E91259